MITLTDVHKRFWTAQGKAQWALRGVNLTIPPKTNVAVLGAAGSGKSTLLRLIAGIDRPTLGEVSCDQRVSWPIGMAAGLQRNLTGRQNTRFICRIHGYHEDELDERIDFVHEFSQLSEAFDQPVSSYSRSMRGQLSFSLSMAFDFDIYLVDERMGGGRGEEDFRDKAKEAMQYLAQRANLIVVSQSERVVRRFCTSAVLLNEGGARWFESLEEGLRMHWELRQ